MWYKKFSHPEGGGTKVAERVKASRKILAVSIAMALAVPATISFVPTAQADHLLAANAVEQCNGDLRSRWEDFGWRNLGDCVNASGASGTVKYNCIYWEPGQGYKNMGECVAEVKPGQ
jgi:hypothetical protein